MERIATRATRTSRCVLQFVLRNKVFVDGFCATVASRSSVAAVPVDQLASNKQHHQHTPNIKFFLHCHSMCHIGMNRLCRESLLILLSSHTLCRLFWSSNPLHCVDSAVNPALLFSREKVGVCEKTATPFHCHFIVLVAAGYSCCCYHRTAVLDPPSTETPTMAAVQCFILLS